MTDFLVQDERSDSAARRADATRSRINAVYTAGLLTFQKRDLPAAHAWFEKGLRMAQAVGESWWVALCLSSEGAVHLFDSKLAEQRAALEESVAVARATGDAWLLTLCLSNLAHAVRLIDNAAALPIIDESLRLAHETGDKLLLARIIPLVSG